MSIISNISPEVRTSRRRGRLRTAAAVLGSLLTVLTFGVPGAYAQETVYRTKRVSFADLNMRSTEGRATLERRVRVAARHVCGRWEFGSLPMHAVRTAQCYRKTTDVALAQVDQIVLAAAKRPYAAETFRPNAD